MYRKNILFASLVAVVCVGLQVAMFADVAVKTIEIEPYNALY